MVANPNPGQEPELEAGAGFNINVNILIWIAVREIPSSRVVTKFLNKLKSEREEDTSAEVFGHHWLHVKKHKIEGNLILR